MGAFTVTTVDGQYGLVPQGAQSSVVPGKIDKNVNCLVTGKLTGPASYDTGGSIVDLSAYLDTIERLAVFSSGARVFEGIEGTTSANWKCKVTITSTGAEVAGAADLTTFTPFFVAVGKPKV